MKERLVCLFELSLYQKMSISQQEVKSLVAFDGFYAQDDYCSHCKQNSVFQIGDNTPKIVSTGVSPRQETSRYNVFEKNQKNVIFDKDFHLTNTFGFMLKCSKCGRFHVYYFYYDFKSEEIIKIGQYPSTDLKSKVHAKKYKELLADDYDEYITAIKNNSVGVGIGAYVYLRRILERLVEEAHQGKKVSDDWNEILYQKSKFSEKIDLVSDIINDDSMKLIKSLYGILSKGIHQLSENECLNSFNVLKTAIELILDEKLATIEKNKKLIRISKELNRIRS